MNPAFLGDSYDLVKRFFIQELRTLGYDVVVEPLFTGEWPDGGQGFFHLLQSRARGSSPLSGRPALFLDPDTGVRQRRGTRHVSFEQLESESTEFELVVTFDQSFSRGATAEEAMRAKLQTLAERGLAAVYYDSHARFLFASRRALAIDELVSHLRGVGIPQRRLLRGGT